MDNKIDFQEEIDKYRDKVRILEDMGEDVSTLINSLLSVNKLNFHDIIYRVKEENSLIKKMRDRNVTFEKIDDILGFRIIVYLESEAKKVNEMIKKEFKVKQSKPFTKSTGFRGTNHYVVLDNKREDLPENKNYKDIDFEIQVVTILSHAWSEIQHDRSYKSEVSDEFKELFELLASSLKLLDFNFDSLCRSIDEKINEIDIKTQKDDIKDILIDSISLRGFLNGRFKDFLGEKIIPIFGIENSETKEVLLDLKKMNIETLESFKAIIPLWIEDYITAQSPYARTDYTDLIRDLLLIKFGQGYCKESKLFKKNKQYNLGKTEDDLLKSKGIDYEVICKPFGILINIEEER